MSNLESTRMSLEFDIRRTIILSEYMKNWRMPEFRSLLSKGDNTVELYSFPCEDGGDVFKYATVGLSACKFEDGTHSNNELVLVVPKYVASEYDNEIRDYVFNIIAYILSTLKHDVSAEYLIKENELAPVGWPKALLFDEPRGEPESLGNFHFGNQHIDLLWLIPIHASELDLINNQGITAFDEAIDKCDVSLADVTRASSV